jgi:hypothetical protein
MKAKKSATKPAKAAVKRKKSAKKTVKKTASKVKKAVAKVKKVAPKVKKSLSGFQKADPRSSLLVEFLVSADNKRDYTFPNITAAKSKALSLIEDGAKKLSIFKSTKKMLYTWYK